MKPLYKTIGIIIILSFSIVNCFAQMRKDSISEESDTFLLAKFYKQDTYIHPAAISNVFFIDTTFSYIHKYNPAYKFTFFPQLTGNIGLSAKSMLFEFSNDVNFIVKKQPLSMFMYYQNNVAYKATPEPFTELSLTTGSKREQIFFINHHQTIYKNLSGGLNYRIINEPGYYLHQKSDIKNFYIYLKYHTSNNRYFADFTHVRNRSRIQENGGIKNDSIFESEEMFNRYTSPVNIEDNQSRLNRRRNADYIFTHYLYLGKPLINSDSSKITYSGFGILKHQIKINTDWSVYEDNQPWTGFYRNIFIKVAQTYDSTNVQNFENLFLWMNNPSSAVKKKFWGLGLSIASIKIHQNIWDSLWNQTSLISFFENDSANKIRFHFNTKYYISGYNRGDIHTKITLKNKTNLFSLPFKTYVEADFSVLKPEWQSNFYYSNHFIWENNFKKFTQAYAAISLNYSGFELGSKVAALINYVYYDYYSQPTQISDVLNAYQIYVLKDFKFGKFHFIPHLFAQDFKGPEVCRVPKFLANGKLFFESILIKNALQTQFGAELSIFSEYYADAYNPALGIFYLQNEKKIGNYPYVDFFANFKLKRARIFVKLDHLNAGFTGGSYFLTPHYPYAPRTFKFGVNWMFFK